MSSVTSTVINHTCSGKHKERLFVGEGNFSFAEAFIKKHVAKHPNLAKAIIATELLTDGDYKNSGNMIPVTENGELDFVYEGEKNTLERIERLKKLGVRILLGLDGAKLQENDYIREIYVKKGRTIPRIHWNLPLNDQSKGDFAKLLTDFFRSCRAIQAIGNRVHITLLQNQNKKMPNAQNFVPEWIFQQGYKANIVMASTVAGYRLIKKRNFYSMANNTTSSRYDGYVTRNSFNGKGLTASQITCIKEFIFEKQEKLLELAINVTKMEDHLKQFQDYTDEQMKKVKVDWWTCKTSSDDKPVPVFYFNCDTDNESSDYSDSEIEQITEQLDKIKVNDTNNNNS